ncbi:grpE protein homolog 1, mitochondrial-like isoform X2 [Rutidosis leptorrhynchoides]|uniref:grpE protein homolog 1, mitochondrial-like isoform X2 n=1 Tax=Rutidosis leptorrhynchoides TaxID=125765 RepID=UPI003A98DE98
MQFTIQIITRIARTVVNRYQTLHGRPGYHLSISNPRFHFHSVTASSHNKVISGQVFLLRNASLSSSTFQKFGFSSSASREPKTSENKGTTSNKKGPNGLIITLALLAALCGAVGAVGTDPPSNHPASSLPSSPLSPSFSRIHKDGCEEELTLEDQFRRLTPTAERLTQMGEPWKTVVPELMKVKDNMIQASADMEKMEDIMSRTSAQNSKKIAIQIFPMSLLDVADDVDRASLVLKESIAKIDTSKDSARDVPILKTLLEGVEMTKKSLSEFFKKYGVEKYDPMNEEFDPNRHKVVFQVQDPTKTPNTVAVVLKVGYTVYGRILRPAEVGVTKKVD